MRQAYTVLSAMYANEDNSAAVAITAEAGAVAISAVDRPELWAQLVGMDVAPFVIDVPPVDVGTEHTGGPNVLA